MYIQWFVICTEWGATDINLKINQGIHWIVLILVANNIEQIASCDR